MLMLSQITSKLLGRGILVRTLLPLGLGLGGVEEHLELLREHDVALDLELAAHECLHGVQLASDELDEVVFGDSEGAAGFLLGLSWVDFSIAVLEVDGPRLGLSSR